MGWNFFKKETKDVDETKETKEVNEEKDNEYVSDFDKWIKVDENGKYMYRETPEDPTKNSETGNKTDAADDEEGEQNTDIGREHESGGGREIDDDDDDR